MTTTGCKKSDSLENNPTEKNKPATGDVSLDNVISDLKKIKSLGFDPLDAQITPDGYRVEGDIHLTKKNLNESVATSSKPQGNILQDIDLNAIKKNYTPLRLKQIP